METFEIVEYEVSESYMCQKCGLICDNIRVAWKHTEKTKHDKFVKDTDVLLAKMSNRRKR